MAVMIQQQQPTGGDLRRYAADFVAFASDLIVPGAMGPARFGDIMADFQRDTFAALAPSLHAVAVGGVPRTPRFWIERTKGASKDTDLAVCILWLLAFSARPILIQCGAADQDQAAELRKAAADILRQNFWLSGQIVVQKYLLVCERTACQCEVLPADASSAHGARPDVLVCNELSHLGSEDFAQTLFDNAAKMPGGLAIVATNAGFVGGWQWKWREIARKNPRWGFFKYAQPPPWVDPQAIEEAKFRNSVARHSRLWWGVWSSGGGDALDSGDIEAAVVLGLPSAPEPGYTYVAGLDLGIKHDHSALVVIGSKPGTGRIRVALCRSWQPGPGGTIDLERVRDAVVAAHRQYRLVMVRYDPYQAALMAQQLHRLGVPVREMVFTGANLDAMAAKLLEAFRGRHIELPEDAELLRDLADLSIVESRSGFGMKLVAPRGDRGHADRAIALSIILPTAMMLMARRPASEQPTQRVVLNPALPMGLHQVQLPLPRHPDGSVNTIAAWRQQHPDWRG